MAAPELRLNVSLDLGFFRQQLQKLTNIAQSEFAPKINAKINRQTLDKELNHVSKMFARRDFRLQVNDTSIKAARLNAQKLKNTLDTIARTKYAINVQGGGAGGFAQSPAGAQGLFEYMRTQGLSGGGGATAVGRTARVQKALEDLTVKQLQSLAKQEGITGTSKLRKNPLIERMMNGLSQSAMENILGNAKMMLQNAFPYVATTGVSGRTLAAKVTGQMPLGGRLPALPAAGQTAAFSMGTMPSNLRQPSMPSGGMMGPSSQLGAGYYSATQGLQGIQSAYGQAKRFLETKNFPVTGAIAEIGSEFGNAIKQVLLFGTAYKALAFLTSLPGQAFEAAKGLATYKNQLQAVTAESGTFEQSFAFVDGLATRFNVPLDSARQGFIKLYASMQPAGFDQGQIEGLFTGISKAAAAFGLSSDKVDRVNYAFAQMASKGQIMSEELKGQLGDVLPGALGLFAKAAQMSIPEFSKAMEDGAFKGKAMEQVLGNVAILFNTQFGAAADGAAKTLQGAVNQIQNNLALMYQAFAPIVDAMAATFGPQVNTLIKDVTDTIEVLTTTLVGGGNGFDTLSPRAQAFYNAIKTLEPALRQAGTALVDMGNRLAQLAPLFIEVLATAISFASSPLARGALIATLAISGLTAALKVLEVTGLKAALKSVYAFISSLAVGIPAATGAAKVALVSLKLAVTGLFVGAILMGLDFLIGKILDIGGAAQKSIQDVKQLAVDLDRLTGAQDMVGLGVKRQEAENEVIIAERLLQTYQKLDKGIRLSGQEQEFLRQYGTRNPLQSGTAFAEAKLTAAMEKRGMAQKSLETAQRLADQENERRKAAETNLTKVDLSGEEKQKKTSLESYYSLQDQLAKNFTQDQIDRMEKEYQARVDRINAEFDLREARANSFQKEAIRYERQIAAIELKRQKALLDASNEVIKAQGSVAGGVRGSTTGATGLLQGSTGISRGAHFDIRRVDGSYISPDQARALLDPAVRSQVSTTSAYGPRNTGIPGASTFHRGVDLAGPANTPLNLAPGYSMVGQGEEGGLGYAATVRGPQGEMYKVGHLQRPSAAAAGAPRKVPGSEKRDIVADQKAQLAVAQKSLAVQIAEAQAIRDAAVAWAEYTNAITPIEEQKLQNSLLVKKNELVKNGLPSDVIEKEMKQFEVQQKTAIAIGIVNKQRTDGLIGKDEEAKRIAELNKNMATYNGLLADNLALQNQQKFDESMGGLRNQLELAGIIDPRAELRARIGQEQPGYSAGQVEEQAAMQERISQLEAARDRVRGVASAIGDAFGEAFKGVITGSMTAQEALAGMFRSIADNFADMVAQMIAEWMKAQLIQGFMSIFSSLAPGAAAPLSDLSAPATINNPLGNLGSIGAAYANGGIAPGGFRAFAGGGVVTGPTLGLVGEGRYNEAVIPLPDGKSVPVQLSGGAGGNAAPINTSIVVNVKNDQAESQMSGNQGNQLARELEGAVRQVILKETRPGGLIAGSR